MNAHSFAVFVSKRLLLAIPLLLLVVVFNFALIQFAPGDPVNVLIGDFPVPESYIEEIRREFGLDKPVFERLLIYVGQVFQGNLGFSFANRQPVLDLVLDRLGATLRLTLTALVFASVVGIFLGAISARHRGKPIDRAIQGVVVAGDSIPEFWLGQILIVVFAVGLGWFPSQGAMSLRAPGEGFGAILSQAHYLVLPALALSFRYLALISRITRASLVEVMNSDFILAARSRGAGERTVLYVHALRNAAAPVVTVIGYNVGFVLAGAALIETVFGWPGIGRLLFTSISARDYPVMVGILLLISATVVIANLVTDIIYGLIDPRIKYR
ncbi:ABC transporter permease [Aliihoeflea sp. PC F10.4]